jgi:D-tyrosyl-tRNA(Tyr) deacylase
MRIVLQRVKEASVSIEGTEKSKIGKGLLILLGIEDEDTQEDIDWLCRKTVNLRIFSDAEGKMNDSLKKIDGEALVVRQFTLHANTRKGTRPSFAKAAKPKTAIPLYEKFIERFELELGKSIGTGEFGADMQVSLQNDGPVTLIMDSKNKM